MSVFRPNTLTSIDNLFTQATLNWHQDAEKTGLDWYLTKHGVFHLLGQGRIDEAKERMLDIYFMAKFANAYTTVVEPWKAWRIVGVETMRTNLRKRIEGHTTLAVDLETFQKIAIFFSNTSVYDLAELCLRIGTNISIGLYGEENINTLILLKNVGHVLTKQGRYIEAEREFNRVSSIVETSSVASIQFDYLFQLYRAKLFYRTGRHEQAEAIYMHLLHADKFIDKEFSQSGVMFELALLCRERGQFKRAEQYCLTALEQMLDLWGDSHPSVRSTKEVLAIIYASQGKYSEAEQLYVDMLNSAESLFGGTHITTLSCLGNLANLYVTRGHLSKAQHLLEHGIQLFPDDGKETNTVYIRMAVNLANLYFDKGEFIKAESWYQQVLKLCEQESLDYWDTFINLAAVYQETLKYDKAEALYLSGYTYCQEHMESNSELKNNLITILVNLGHLNFDQHRKQVAEKYYNEALETLQTLDSPTLQECLMMEALLEYFLDAGDQIVSVTCSTWLYTYYVQLYGHGHIQTLMAYMKLAWFCLMSQSDLGEPYFMYLLQYLKAPTDWKHHWAKLGLALTNALESGDFTSAESTIADLTDLLGPEHDRVGKAHTKLLSVREFYQSRG